VIDLNGSPQTAVMFKDVSGPNLVPVDLGHVHHPHVFVDSKLSVPIFQPQSPDKRAKILGGNELDMRQAHNSHSKKEKQKWRRSLHKGLHAMKRGKKQQEKG
jgi:hypothetical protein